MMQIQFLYQKPKMEGQVRLYILPLAPLSMVSDIPGTYYNASDTPNKIKLCGLFENILGWHFSQEDRTKISKEIIEYHKKKLKDKDFNLPNSNSGYIPLLTNFFEIGMVYKNEPIRYNDLWKKSFSRMDAEVHPKGTPNIDYNILRRKGWIKEEEEVQARKKEMIKNLDKDRDKAEIERLKKETKKSALLKFFSDNSTGYPMFYTSPTLREYVDYTEGEIQIGLKMDNNLLTLLESALKETSTAYLGNSEGWVELKIEEL